MFKLKGFIVTFKINEYNTLKNITIHNYNQCGKCILSH